ncbi:LysE family translocator [Fodinicurvata halophila]|uniref:LysE family translocator n=1 Tax=Fodinicurvata halophila TaxID=1419723 RepID=A0ABV8UPL1_9PROT
MSESIQLTLILGTALIASLSPGPTTLAIASTSMTCGRRFGLALASGVMTGSLLWSVSAAFGLGAIMLTNAWALEILRYLGASYLVYLAAIAGRKAMTAREPQTNTLPSTSLGRAYGKGLAIHLTNPKAALFFGSLYSIAIPSGATLQDLILVIAAIGLQSFLVFHGYALLFSIPPVVRGYLRLRRWFEAFFALAFASAGIKVLLTRVA